ncbi:MAG TPA: glycosyltransferase family 39 protein [Fimbriimonadaceae bacterium]|nr:glycosyltransferase family 39 protein [Fimbriimonadaceae bacterium]
MKNARGALFVALLIAIVHAVFAIVYASETPYRTPGRILIYGGTQAPDIGAPDERQHANYIQTLLDSNGFPVFAPGGPNAGEHYEDHQPPLFYLAEAGFAKILGISSVEDPVAARLRWLNALFGALTVLGVYALGVWGLGRFDVALGACAITAFLPMNCALSGAISNDPLLFAICTWTLAVCALAVRQGWSMKLAILAGVLAGLGILTKTTAVALLPILLLAILLPQKRRPTYGMAAIALFLVLVLAGPWLIRNQRLYGDPLALKAFNQAFTGSRQKVDQVAQIEYEDQRLGIEANPQVQYWRDWVGWWTARSFFGVFGYMDIWLNENGSPYQSLRTPQEPPNIAYRVLLAISLILFLAWLGSFFLPEWKEARPVQLLNAAFLAIVMLLFIRFNMQYFQGQGRYLYPAIGPIAIALSVGCFVLLRNRGAVAVAAMAMLLLLVNVYAVAKLPDDFARRTSVAKLEGGFGASSSLREQQSTASAHHLTTSIPTSAPSSPSSPSSPS